jgi:outer membrane receptor protein involved in Fe transport
MGQLSGRATASARKGNADVLVSVAALNSDGDIRFAGPADATTGVPQTVLNSDGEKAIHADLAGHLGAFSLRAGFNERKKNLPTGAFNTQPLLVTSYLDDRRAYAELLFEQVIHGVHVAARAAYDASRFHGYLAAGSTNPDENPDERIGAQWTTGELRVELPPLLRQRLTLGGEIAQQLALETVAPGGPPIEKDLIASAYLVDDFRVSERLRVNLGVRSDSYTKSFGTTLNPRLAIVGKPYLRGNTKLLFGRSFRAPSPNERANTLDGILRPEIIYSAEIEHAHAFSDDLRIVGAVFANWISDLLVVVQDSDPAVGAILQNKSNRVRSLGAEGELRWEPGGGTLLSLSVTRQRIEELTSTGNLPFLNAPETLVKARVLYPLVGKALRLGSELVLDSGRHFNQTDSTQPAADDRVDDAFLWNVSFSGEFRTYHLRYFAGIFNLLDARDARMGFPTSVDYPQSLIPRYGRSMRAGLSVAF